MVGREKKNPVSPPSGHSQSSGPLHSVGRGVNVSEFGVEKRETALLCCDSKGDTVGSFSHSERRSPGFCAEKERKCTTGPTEIE